MGQKIHPKAVRLGYIQDWESKWFSLKDMPALIGEDFKIRSLVKNQFRQAAISWVGIERAGSYLRVNIHTARPGVVIGKKGVDIEAIKSQIENLTSRKTFVNVVEIKEPELDARLVAEAIAIQLEKRAAYRRTLKRTMERTIQAGALGIKVMVSGRLNGNEIARREWMREGRVPLHTFCADIDYGLAEAHTMAGLIGVKVWIFKKEHFVKSHKELLTMAKKALEAVAEAAPAAEAPATIAARGDAEPGAAGPRPEPPRDSGPHPEDGSPAALEQGPTADMDADEGRRA
ncbi:MAG: 30S ribosomal protein S3 [Elusimicrobia bacterium]|nr:30S ribosomal protein S3 [Elusimicrobiota bacterium]